MVSDPLDPYHFGQLDPDPERKTKKKILKFQIMQILYLIPYQNDMDPHPYYNVAIKFLMSFGSNLFDMTDFSHIQILGPFLLFLPSFALMVIERNCQLI